MPSKPWYQSTILLAALLFAVVFTGYIALLIAGVEVPGWIPAMLVGMQPVVFAVLRVCGISVGGAPGAPVVPSPPPPSKPPGGPLLGLLLCLGLGLVGLLMPLGCGLLTGSTVPTVVAGAGTVLRVASGACRIVEGLEGVKSQVDRAGFQAACAAGPADSVIVACQDIDQGDEVRLLWVGADTCEACVRPEG